MENIKAVQNPAGLPQDIKCIVGLRYFVFGKKQILSHSAVVRPYQWVLQIEFESLKGT